VNAPLAIVDYGAGNLRSVQKAFEHLGHPAEVTADPARIAQASGVVLPGQGAFGSCMRNLEAAGLVAAVRDAIASGRPFLGICVGMQLLFESSEESPGVPGLGVLRGRIVRFANAPERKVPQIGWNQLRVVRPAPVLAGIPDGSWVYFLHSFYAVPEDPGVAATVTSYGVDYVSSVWRDNVFAGVFHPEKSQRVGLAMFANFLRVVEEAA
jgi:glutamine amidotransferase